eukprot:scaffold2366_cov159-Amphora_coffeaeformis.AAC.30
MMNFMKRGSNKIAPLAITSNDQETLSDVKKTLLLDTEEVASDDGADTTGTDELSSSASNRSLESLDGREETQKDEPFSEYGQEETQSEVPALPSLVRVPEEEPLHACLDELLSRPSDGTGVKSVSAPPQIPPPRSSKPPRPRHRRTSSAMPRLETLHEGRATIPEEKPPLPPRKMSLGSFASPLTTPSARAHSQTFSQLPSYPEAPSTSGPNRPQRTHRRTLSAPPKQPEGFLDVTALQQQLKQLQQQYGETHAMVATTWNWLGNAHFRQGNMEAALKAYKNVVLCDPGEHLADAYANMGTVHWTTGNVEEAIPFLQNALSVHEYNVMSRGQDPNTSLPVAGVQYQLGLALTLHKDYEQALFALNQARAIRERVLGHNHMDVARTLDAMGKAHFLQGTFESAVECHRQSLSIKECLPQEVARATIAVTMSNIVEVHRAQGLLADAGMWMHRLIATQKNDFMTLKTKALCAGIGASLTALGEIYDSAMQYSEGASCFREAEMYLVKARIPEEDPRRVALRNRLSL